MSTVATLPWDKTRMSQEQFIQVAQVDWSALYWLSSLTQTYVTEISLALVMTALAIYGNDINGMIRRRTQHLHFIVRTGLFVAVCAFGYGWLSLTLAPQVSRGLVSVPGVWLPLLVMTLFVGLGILAERKRKI